MSTDVSIKLLFSKKMSALSPTKGKYEQHCLRLVVQQCDIAVQKRYLPSVYNQTHSKVEAWASWSASPKTCFNCDKKLTPKWIRDTSSNVLYAPKPDT